MLARQARCCNERKRSAAVGNQTDDATAAGRRLHAAREDIHDVAQTRALHDQLQHAVVSSLKLLGLTKRITDLLSITKLLTVFETYDNEADAVRSFSSSAGA